MKSENFKKLISIALTVMMLLGVIVPGTVFTASAAAPTSYPAPILKESPTYLKDFAKPSVSISTDFSDAYTLPESVTGSAQSGAPIIATITEQAGPNDSISIYGSGLKDASVYAYGLVGGQGVIKKLEQTLNKEGFINAVIDKNFQYTMYIVWVQGADGKVSAPVRVNAPKLTWLGDTEAKSGATGLRIYGKFLTTNNTDVDATSYVYLTNGTSYYKATVTEATPYRLTVNLPSLSNGTYKVWVHNGHGGDYGWSNSLDLKISSTNAISWSTSSIYQVTVKPGDNLKSKIANARDGSTITIKNGIYVVNQQITINKKLRIKGESKDGVIIVCMFTQNGGSNSLAYGDLNVNTNAKAAFYVTKTPTEFSNLTFADYVEGAEYCTGLTKPSGYSIDYAHGMFIWGAETTDTGVSGTLKVNNCNFKVRRIHSDTNCIYFGDSQRLTIHTAIEKIYGTQYYSRTAYGSSPMWIDTNNTEISNCYFETPKEISLRQANGSYIHDNTFVGTWVISGNSGPSVIHDYYTHNLDISNNRAYGLDEVTDPDGYVKTYDQTYARTFVFQKVYNVSKNTYIMNNDVSRVGELNYNSGEHILFEDENVTYVGKVTLSNSNKTLYLKDMPSEKWTSDNKFKGYITGDNGTIKLAGYTRSVAGQVVIISNGTGAGQWRTIASASSRSVTIDRDWDVQPDENSTFVVVSPFINSVVYNNKIEGPKKYYNNFNSTLGINAYGSMVGAVVDRNNFSQMQAGIAINPHYNMKSYTYDGASVSVDYNFVMFADLLVMNNTIKDTRYGIWNFPSLTMNGMDNTTAEAKLDLQLCSIIRNNKISDQRRLVKGAADTNTSVVTDSLVKRGGVSIVVGRDYWASSDVISTRNWMNNIVVENNTLSNVVNNNGHGYIDVGFSQNDTIIRNNTYDGALKESYAEVEVERNTHSTGKKPNPPIFILPPKDNENDGGTEEDGMIQDSTLAPTERIANNDFLEGFKYWSNATGINYASADATVANSVATINKGKEKGLKSSPFNIPKGDLSSRSAENKVAFVVKYTSSSSAFNLQLYVNGVAQGNASSVLYSSGKLKLFYYNNVTWNEKDTYSVAITSNTGTATIGIDYVDIARCETSAAILDLINGRVYSSSGDITDNTANNTISENFTNVEFASGLDQWKKVSHFGSASASNGAVTLTSSAIQSDYFTADLNDGDKIAIIYNFTSATNAKVALKRKDVKSGVATDSTLIDAVTVSKSGLAVTSTFTYRVSSGAESYLSIVAEGEAVLDYISVVSVTGSGVNLVYTDIVSGKRYLSDMRDPDGTAEAGFEKIGKKYTNNETYAINDTLMNGDFSEGLKFWTAAINTTATSSGVTKANAADSAKKVENGVVTLHPSGGSGRGISSAHFKVPNAAKYKRFVVVFDYAHTVGSITGLASGTDYTAGYHDQFKVEVLKGSSHTSAKANMLKGTNGAWQTGSLSVAIENANDFYVLSFEGFNINTEFKIKNIRLMFEDNGGLANAPIINLDGSLQDTQSYGDATNDGDVDLLDLVRMKKQLAGKNNSGIFFAAADVTKDGTLNASDLVKVVAMIIGKK